MTRIAYSVYRLAKVLGSNPAGWVENFRTRQDRLWGPPNPPVKREQRPGCGVDYPLPSSADVKNEWSYTSTAPLGLHGLLYGEFYFVRWRWVVSFTPQPVYFCRNNARYAMGMILDGPQSLTRRFGKQKNVMFLLAIGTQSLGHPSCNLVAIWTELSQFSSGHTVFFRQLLTTV